jgi:tRNA threonylcarbamoyladenosine dehydratase
MNQFSRTELLIGSDGLEKLKNSHIAVFGIGGVGGFIAESLARCGVGKLTLIDCDSISLTNINRQIIALNSTIGKSKTDVMKNRIEDINPNCQVNSLFTLYNSESAEEIFKYNFDYVADAIDMVSAKIDLIVRAKSKNIPIISSMGTGNKFAPELLKISDISKTSVCPLARVMRKELAEAGVKKLQVVFSTEIPQKPAETSLYQQELALSGKRQIPGSISFVPPVAGLMIASVIIRNILEIKL